MTDGSSGPKEANRLQQFAGTVIEAGRKWSDDKCARLGAAIAYYTLFSVAPLLIVAVGIAGLVFGPEAAEGEVAGRIEDQVGPSVAELLQDMMAGTQHGVGVVATVVGVLLTVLAASGLFLQLKSALNVVWGVPVEATKGFANLLRTRGLAFLSVLRFGVLLLVVLAASSVVSAMETMVPEEVSFVAPLAQWLNPVVMVLLLTGVFGAVFRILPDVTAPWRAIWRGAVFTSVLFTIGTFLLGLYLGSGAVGTGFGAAAALVTLLIYAFYSAQIFLLGAEYTRVLHLRMESEAIPVQQFAAVSEEPSLARRIADSGPAAAVWAFLAGLVLGWWKKR